MNYKEFLRSWNPWHLRKRIAEQNAAFSRLFNENQVLQFQHSCHLGDIEHLKQQRDSNYTGLMTECEKLKKENERLKQEVEQKQCKYEQLLIKFNNIHSVLHDLDWDMRKLSAVISDKFKHFRNDKGDTHEQIGN